MIYIERLHLKKLAVVVSLRYYNRRHRPHEKLANISFGPRASPTPNTTVWDLRRWSSRGNPSSSKQFQQVVYRSRSIKRGPNQPLHLLSRNKAKYTKHIRSTRSFYKLAVAKQLEEVEESHPRVYYISTMELKHAWPWANRLIHCLVQTVGRSLARCGTRGAEFRELFLYKTPSLFPRRARVRNHPLDLLLPSWCMRNRKKVDGLIKAEG